MIDRNAYMREWTRKNKDRLNAEERQRLITLKETNPEEYKRIRTLRNKANKKYYEKHHEEIITQAKAKNWYYDPIKRVDIRARCYQKDPIKQVLRARKAQAKKKGLSFTLTKEWYDEQFKKGCAVTKLPFDKHRSDSPWVAHIDRKIPELGYIPENCQLVCACYNIAKKHWTHLDVICMAQALIESKSVS